MKRATDIEEEAAQWLVQLDSQGSPERWAALDAWLSSNPRHRAAFLRLSVAWTRSENLRRMRPLDQHVDPDLLSPRARRTRRHSSWMRPRWVLGATAAAIGFIVAGLAFWKGSEVSGGTELYATQIGKPAQEFILPDGSTVVLNTNSEVRVTFTPTHREVRLLHGQALFEVTHNSKRPFDVVAGSSTVRAVGTRFLVRMRDQSAVDVLVTEGRVALNPPSSATLGAGQAARLVGTRVEQWNIENEEVVRKLSWVQGKLSFKGETLSEVVMEFNQVNRRRMVIPDPAVAAKPVLGTFSALDPESFIEAIGPTLKVRGRESDSFFGPRVIRLEASEEPMNPSD